jgi:hypothetical protein
MHDNKTLMTASFTGPLIALSHLLRRAWGDGRWYLHRRRRLLLLLLGLHHHRLLFLLLHFIFDIKDTEAFREHGVNIILVPGILIVEATLEEVGKDWSRTKYSEIDLVPAQSAGPAT